MKQYLLLFMLAVVVNGSTAQTATNEDVNQLKKEVSILRQQLGNQRYLASSQQSSINTLQSDLSKSKTIIDSLQAQVGNLKNALSSAEEKLGSDITKTNLSLADNTDSLKASISTKSVIGFLTILIVALLSGIGLLFLRRKLSNSESAIDTVRDAQKKLEEESVKLDNQLIDVLNNQIKAQSVQLPPSPDHSLVRKVADEIVRIELNLSRMDPSIKGYKQLTKGVERIKDNFKAKGYEITDMLGKPYVEGMKVVANFISDETLPEGSQIITGIIKPQIIYNGTMIQAAEITVSQNI